MEDMPAVVSAEYAGEFRIRLGFGDGLEATVDFRPWLVGPVFEPLLDVAFFQRFSVEAGTVVWPNGADIAPEALHAAAAAQRAA